MDSFEQAWELICDYCKSQITGVAYKTWFSSLKPISLDFTNNVATIEAPNEFHMQTLLRGYSDVLGRAFESVFGAPIRLSVTVPQAAPAKKEAPAPDDDSYELTFDTFVVGSSNRFAHAACQAVAAKPAVLYNPLFIYGNSGLGKTHLLYAIANEIEKNNPATDILYVKGEEFTNELVDAIAKESTSAFHAKYRQADVLLVDDIQFIGGKEQTQEEFFHTFNALYHAQKQIVLTSDRPPKEIKTLEDRLRTRFEWGLLADIQPPDFETRIAIIRRKAELLDIDINDEVAQYIANRLKTNIRQLEGAVKKLKAFHLLTGAPPTISTAQNAIRDILNDNQPVPVTIERIISEVGRTYNVTPEDIRSSKRASQISQARQTAIYVVREITQMSQAAIGEEFGGRDHSTVVYALKQVEKSLKIDPRFKEMVEDIIKNIRDS